jgi:NAD(P)-dependent dehydrogenase (short-subunit alcohol dehydrogenase family)
MMTITALITGGTSGIGQAAANKLAQLGMHVMVVGRSEERGKKTIDEIRNAGGQADFIASDLRDASSVREVARRAVELGNGHVDILINNAGVYPFGPTHEMTEEQFDKVYSLNVKAPYFLVAELAPLMVKRGKGAIVNVSTMVADYGVDGRIWPWRRSDQCGESWSNPHGGYGGDGRGARATCCGGTGAASSHGRRDCRSDCLLGDRSL